jgi:hypothetical protein
MKRTYIVPTAFAVVIRLREGLLTGSAIGVSDGDSVGDRQVTVDDADNQFVKSYNQWDKEW